MLFLYWIRAWTVTTHTAWTPLKSSTLLLWSRIKICQNGYIICISHTLLVQVYCRIPHETRGNQKIHTWVSTCCQRSTPAWSPRLQRHKKENRNKDFNSKFQHFQINHYLKFLPLCKSDIPHHFKDTLSTTRMLPVAFRCNLQLLQI